jgi:predicted LPLAT superfamily acyltransferase
LAIWIFAALVSVGYFLLLPKRRAESARFYAILWPGASRYQRLWLTFCQYQSFAATYAEERLLGIPGAIRVVSQGYRELAEAVRAGTGAVLVMSHMGSWQLGARLLAARDVRLTVVKGNQSERMQASEQLQQGNLEIKIHPASAAHALDMLDLLRRVREGQIVSLAGDRAWVKGSRELEVEVMGHQAAVTAAPYALALAAAAPLFICFALRESWFTYRFECLPALRLEGTTRSERQQAMLEAARTYARELEARLKSHPRQWYGFLRFLGDPVANG